MGEKQNYGEAVKAIKTAILQSQYDAARTVNEKQLMLYYGIGKYKTLLLFVISITWMSSARISILTFYSLIGN
ncbi:hypothetical protein [Schaedlerella arabinosiphila]|uniref:hypothetical protein n=1 Tax=Schaedlerella arabinosiphila TaxID=2044587 RepID=UPI0002CBEA96|nr:hypothetical protein [Schaedlerella arabinosiphila]KAI4443480.1 hypothetical protein C824_006015 [Schaedlerella arabinosiphila]